MVQVQFRRLRMKDSNMRTRAYAQVNEAYRRLVRNHMKYCLVIDMASLNGEAVETKL
jgi:hypothetical protein